MTRSVAVCEPTWSLVGVHSTRFVVSFQTIPAGAFVRTPEDDGFQFKSNSPGIKQLLIRDNGVFRVWATELDLSGMDSAQPVVFVLGIGNDEGSANIASAERLRIR